VAFEPTTEGQKLLHGETLHAYSQMIEARRLRLDAVNTGLPGIMWCVIIVGALVSLSSTFFFEIEDTRLQKIQVVLLTLFVGLIIFIIFALDRPFRGDLGLQPDAYRLIYDQLMKS
jgi:ABC-type branched-subunit amino acid transport system permease subunit